MNTYICTIIYFIIIITSIFIILVYVKGQRICDLSENKKPSLLPSTLLSQANILKPQASMSLSQPPLQKENIPQNENIAPTEINDNIIIALATSGLFKI